jgi:hypothetical protein
MVTSIWLKKLQKALLTLTRLNYQVKSYNLDFQNITIKKKGKNWFHHGVIKYFFPNIEPHSYRLSKLTVDSFFLPILRTPAYVP